MGLKIFILAIRYIQNVVLPMYKQMPDLSPEEVRKYKALATYGNIKGYL